MPHRLQHLTAPISQKGQLGLEKVIGPSDQFLLNRFFDLIIPSENLKNPKQAGAELCQAQGKLRLGVL